MFARKIEDFGGGVIAGAFFWAEPNDAVTLRNRLATSQVFGGGIDQSTYRGTRFQPSERAKATTSAAPKFPGSMTASAVSEAPREAIEQQLRQCSEEAFGALQRGAAEKSIALLRTPTGLALAPMRDGKVTPPEVFGALPEAERQRVEHEIEGIQSELEAMMRQVPLWERDHRDSVQALNRETTGFAISFDGGIAPRDFI